MSASTFRQRIFLIKKVARLYCSRGTSSLLIFVSRMPAFLFPKNCLYLDFSQPSSRRDTFVSTLTLLPLPPSTRNPPSPKRLCMYVPTLRPCERRKAQDEKKSSCQTLFFHPFLCFRFSKSGELRTVFSGRVFRRSMSPLTIVQEEVSHLLSRGGEGVGWVLLQGENGG